MVVAEAERDRSVTPCVLVIGGHDPSGAGIQADIETCAAFNCLPLSVVTALTTQNTAGVSAIRASRANDLIAQIELLLEEFPIAAIKLGMVPNRALASAIDQLLAGPLARLPLVIDPLLSAGSGRRLSTQRMLEIWRDWLLPRASICTPNRFEALALTATTDIPAAAERLLAIGCGAVLITDTLASETIIQNELYARGLSQRFEMQRFTREFHGTGCTLASAIAAGLAWGDTVQAAVAGAQSFVHRACATARDFGGHQAIPNRSITR